ncbi:MAG: helix-turn-helix domain-containing protein [Bacteroidales bacterium]
MSFVYRITLTQKQEHRLRQLVKAYRDQPHILRRLYCVLLKNEGQSNGNITRLLNIHEDTVADWIRCYKKQGVPALMTFGYHRRRKSILAPYKGRIKQWARAQKTTTVKQLQLLIQQRLDIVVEYSWLYRWCRKNDILAELRK